MKNKRQNIIAILLALIILTIAIFAIASFREAILYNPLETSFPLKDIILIKAIPYTITIILMTAIALTYYFRTPKK